MATCWLCMWQSGEYKSGHKITFSSPLLSESYHLEFLSLPRLDPLDPLQLGVDHQRPALRIGQDCSILCRHAVTGEVLIVPAGDGGCISEQRQHV